MDGTAKLSIGHHKHRAHNKTKQKKRKPSIRSRIFQIVWHAVKCVAKTDSYKMSTKANFSCSMVLRLSSSLTLIESESYGWRNLFGIFRFDFVAKGWKSTREFGQTENDSKTFSWPQFRLMLPTCVDCAASSHCSDVGDSSIICSILIK